MIKDIRVGDTVKDKWGDIWHVYSIEDTDWFKVGEGCWRSAPTIVARMGLRPIPVGIISWKEFEKTYLGSDGVDDFTPKGLKLKNEPYVGPQPGDTVQDKYGQTARYSKFFPWPWVIVFWIGNRK